MNAYERGTWIFDEYAEINEDYASLSLQEALIDLLTDLRIASKESAAEREIDWEAAIRMSEIHSNEE